MGGGGDQHYVPFWSLYFDYIPYSLGDQEGPIVLINPYIGFFCGAFIRFCEVS